MLNYIVKRLLYGLVSIALTTVIVCSIIFVIPVDPTRMTFGQRLDKKTLELKTQQYGLDRSLGRQLWLFFEDLSPIYLTNKKKELPHKYTGFRIVHLASYSFYLKYPFFRHSYQTGRSVSSILREAWPLTLILAMSSIILAGILGVSLGWLATVYKGSWIDRLLLSIGILGYSVPSYVSALFFSLVFGFFLHHVTGLNLQGSLIELDYNGQEVWKWKNLVLPTLALGIRPVAVIMQITRSSLSDVMQRNYIITAKAKGLNNLKLWLKHGLYNAANPIISTITSWFASLIAGAFFVETIFNYHGIGSTTVEALLHFDIPVLLGCILTVGVLLVIVNIITDIIYRVFDPSLELE